ncbi:50S ribosomal protein L21 [Silvibacterium acidisoli]|uniref:50S ribosomal protein L21 n=1 Tax=Acidobacteriaceae bacterium ZG23-2 TaxID=2883246 RepID=UPI00406BEBBD
MYAVIRTGGKQYRVAPGDVVKVETVAAGENGAVEFADVLAFSGENGITQPESAKVVGTVLNEGRAPKILVFHYKRKKQYKKMQGHRQDYSQVRIDSIQVDGNTYSAAK